jgi:prepilin-type processing-associated H-X9-DG protein
MSYTLNADDSYLGRGPFALHDIATRLQSVTDGTASTVAVSERATTFAGGTEADAVQTPIRYHWEIVTNPLPRPSTSSQRGVVTELAVHDCLHGPRRFDPWNEPGVASWRNPNSSLAVHSHLLGPNSVQCWDPVDGSVGGLSYSTVTSLHSGGANVSFLDGQVRLINQNLDLAVWRACGTIAGGESIQMP